MKMSDWHALVHFSTVDVILALFDWHDVEVVDVMHLNDCAFFAE